MGGAEGAALALGGLSVVVTAVLAVALLRLVRIVDALRASVEELRRGAPPVVVQLEERRPVEPVEVVERRGQRARRRRVSSFVGPEAVIRTASFVAGTRRAAQVLRDRS